MYRQLMKLARLQTKSLVGILGALRLKSNRERAGFLFLRSENTLV